MISKKVFAIVSIGIAMNISTTDSSRAEPSATVSAREPLTHQNMGVYGWWDPYFWEGPFDFVIAQAFVLPHESLTEVQNVSDAAGAKAWNERLM